MKSAYFLREFDGRDVIVHQLSMACCVRLFLVEEDGFTFFLCSTGASNSVDVVFWVERNVEVDDCGDVVDVDTTSNYVSGDKDAFFAARKLLKRFNSVVLFFSAE